MTTQEKIEVMQAYESGEQIQIANADKNEWRDIEDPSWNWAMYKYRIKPKGNKFKIGDEFVDFEDEGIPLFGGDIYKVTGIGKLWYEVKNLCGIDLSLDFMPADLKRINTNSVLWYWEYQDEDGRWHKTDYRATRAEIEKLSNFHNFNPLYALGFRLSQNLKDEK